MLIDSGSRIEYSKVAFNESYHHLRGNPDNLPKAKPKIKKSSPQTRPVFTPEQVEKRLVAVLTPVLQAKPRLVFTFTKRTLAGHGIVLVLSTGQEFWLTLAEASF